MLPNLGLYPFHYIFPYMIALHKIKSNKFLFQMKIIHLGFQLEKIEEITFLTYN